MSKSRTAVNGPLGEGTLLPQSTFVSSLDHSFEQYWSTASLMDTFDLSDLPDNVTGTNDAEAIFAHDGSDTVHAGGGDDVVYGGAGMDQIFGDAGDDFLDGGSSADQIHGGAGHDILQGGAGADELIGGTGNDLYFVDSGSDIVTESAGEGWDAVVATTSVNMPFAVEALLFEQTPGQASKSFTAEGNELDNLIVGSSLSDTFWGREGHDTLDGGAGADTLHGNQGNDTYLVDNVGDQAIELAGQGTDLVVTTLGSWTLGAHLENLQFDGSVGGPASFVGIGNGLDNKIFGSDLVDTLFGLDGHDTLYGNAGKDALTGGNGDDKLYGGAGDDQLFGNAGWDLLDGGTGADVMKGGAGNDVYWVDNPGDVTDEAGGSGNDAVHSTVNQWAMANDIEALYFKGSGNFVGWGNALPNAVWGGGGDDSLYGFGGKDSLVGGDGHDKLYGGSGDDSLIGGTGNDVLVGGAGSDVLSGGAGNDRFVMDTQDAKGDMIDGFQQGSDKIDLSSFDAQSWVAGDQAFQFMGPGAFAGDGIGSVRYANVDSHITRVFVDIDGDAVSDFDFGLYNDAPVQLVGTDFLL